MSESKRYIDTNQIIRLADENLGAALRNDYTVAALVSIAASLLVIAEILNEKSKTGE